MAYRPPGLPGAGCPVLTTYLTHLLESPQSEISTTDGSFAGLDDFTLGRTTGAPVVISPF